MEEQRNPGTQLAKLLEAVEDLVETGRGFSTVESILNRSVSAEDVAKNPDTLLNYRFIAENLGQSSSYLLKKRKPDRAKQCIDLIELLYRATKDQYIGNIYHNTLNWLPMYSKRTERSLIQEIARTRKYRQDMLKRALQQE